MKRTKKMTLDRVVIDLRGRPRSAAESVAQHLELELTRALTTGRPTSDGDALTASIAARIVRAMGSD
jgi:hypothetical protein